MQLYVCNVLKVNTSTCCVLQPLFWIICHLNQCCCAFRNETPQLFTVLPERRTGPVGAAMMASTHIYDISGVRKLFTSMRYVLMKWKYYVLNLLLFSLSPITRQSQFARRVEGRSRRAWRWPLPQRSWSWTPWPWPRSTRSTSESSRPRWRRKTSATWWLSTLPNRRYKSLFSHLFYN